MCYYNNKIKNVIILITFLIKGFIKIYFIIWIVLISIHPIVYSKNISYKIDAEQKFKQLHQISDAHSQCLIQLQQQLSENQQDIDMLRGNIQNIQYNISEMTKNQNELYKKLNAILNQYKNIQKYDLNDTKTKSIVPFNSETLNKNEIHETKINDIIDTDYKTAVKLVLEKKQYNQAIQAFKNFIQNYPKSNYQSNAHYWLGQLYYNQGNKDNASYHFALVVKNYPKSSKAPDALLKIGIIMQETNQKDKAKTIYKQIGKLYPNSDSAKHAQKRLTHL